MPAVTAYTSKHLLCSDKAKQILPIWITWLRRCSYPFSGTAPKWNRRARSAGLFSAVATLLFPKQLDTTNLLPCVSKNLWYHIHLLFASTDTASYAHASSSLCWYWIHYRALSGITAIWWFRVGLLFEAIFTTPAKSLTLQHLISDTAIKCIPLFLIWYNLSSR